MDENIAPTPGQIAREEIAQAFDMPMFLVSMTENIAQFKDAWQELTAFVADFAGTLRSLAKSIAWFRVLGLKPIPRRTWRRLEGKVRWQARMLQPRWQRRSGVGYRRHRR